ncbi:DUF7096 domain-containing protein [Natronobiforma cellulositropha]|uniref:DUF7096 domain-containing protein n=1 Tax=Natronobiforma cellulositropha TaxID=1679076 RepID=UPI0021D5DDCE|nr:hypothetical protein [Natronobiforma cellulositropha]
MNSAVPALLALLLVGALPAMAVVAAGPDDVAGTVSGDTPAQPALAVEGPSDPLDAVNTTNRLPLAGDVTSTYVRSHPDFGVTLSIGDSALRTEYDAFVFETRFEELSPTERREAIDSELERVDEEIEALREREHRAVREHAAGERSDRALLQEFTQSNADAVALTNWLDQLVVYANDVPGYSIGVRSQKEELGVYRGPVREHLVMTTSADGSTRQAQIAIAIQTSETGVTLGILDRDRYLRETTRYDHRNVSAPDQIGGYSNASALFEEQYPWTDDVSRSSQGLEFIDRQLYIRSVPHDHGEIDVYFDGGTGAVYYESQRLLVNQLPVETPTETWTNESLELAINRTVANGPIEVTVTDESGDPVRATVLVGETVVGETNADGVLWILPPHGEFDLTAQAGDSAVTATLGE